MMSQAVRVRNSPKKVSEPQAKRVKVSETKEIKPRARPQKAKKLTQKRKPTKPKKESKYEIDLTEFKAILKKPKKNITAYAFFIKEVGAQNFKNQADWFRKSKSSSQAGPKTVKRPF